MAAMRNNERVRLVGREFVVHASDGRYYLLSHETINGYAVRALLGHLRPQLILLGADRFLGPDSEACPEFPTLPSFLSFVSLLRSLEDLKCRNGWEP